MASVSNIRKTMRAYTDAQTLTAQTGWTVDNVSGSGILTSDEHTDHAHKDATNNQVIDASDVGYGAAIWDADTLDSDDQTAEVGIWFDTSASTAEYSVGHLYLRFDGTTYGSASGYRFQVSATSVGMRVYIQRVDSGSSTKIASDETGTINESDEERHGVVRLTFTAVGSTLTGYINGREVLSTTDTNHTGATHRYAGWGLNRSVAATYSQPFGTNFAAWSDNYTNQAYTEYLGGTINTGDNGSSATATATNSLDAAADEELFAVIYIKDYLSDEAPGVTSLTDDGTGTWTLETSQVDGTDQIGYYVYSKTAAGDETSLSLVADGLSYIVMETYRFPTGWAYETAAWNSASAAAVTGTLSSDDKIGLAISAASESGGSGTAFADGDFDRPIQVGMASQVQTDQVPVFASALHDLGTATTAFTVDPASQPTSETAGAIVFAKSAGGPTGSGTPTDTQDTATGTGTSTAPISTGVIGSPPAYFEDDFNRADGAVGAGWVDDVGASSGGINIVSNQAISDIDWSWAAAWCATEFTVAQFAQADGPTLSTQGDRLGLTVNGAGSGRLVTDGDSLTAASGYTFWFHPWDDTKDGYLSRSGSTVVTESGTAPLGQTIRIEHDGAGEVTVYGDGAQITSYTDGTALTGTYTAVSSWDTPFDNFSAGDIVQSQIVKAEAFTGATNTGRTYTRATVAPTLANGDALVVIMDLEDIAETAGVGVTSPTGFTLIGSQYHTNGSQSQEPLVYVKYITDAASEPTTYVFSHTSTYNYGAMTHVKNAAVVADPVFEIRGGTYGNSVTMPAVTVGQYGAILGASFAWGTGANGETADAPWDAVPNANLFPAGSSFLAGETVTSKTTYSSDTNSWASVAVAIAPPVPPTPPTDTQDTASGTGTSVAPTSTGATGSSPAQRGSVTTTASIDTGWPITAPTGLAEDDVVYIVIASAATVAPGYTLSGFTVVAERLQAGGAIALTVLRGAMGASPPANFTPSPTTAPSAFNARCVAWSGADTTANEVVGAWYDATPNGPTTVALPGVTVADDGSILLAVTYNRYTTTSISGWTSLSDNPDMDYVAADSGASGTTTVAVGNTWQPVIGLQFSVPHVSPPTSAFDTQDTATGTGTSVAPTSTGYGAPPASFSDDFNRADGAPGADWGSYGESAGATLDIKDGKLGPSAATIQEYAGIWQSPSTGTAQFVQADLTTDGVGANPGDRWRMSLGLSAADAWDVNNYPPFQTSGIHFDRSMSLTTCKLRDSSGTLVTSSSNVFAAGIAGNTVRMEWDGTDARVYVDGSEEIDYTGGTSDSIGKYVGLDAKPLDSQWGATFDNFSAGDLPPALFSDDFNRADEILGNSTDWYEQTVEYAVITSNHVEMEPSSIGLNKWQSASYTGVLADDQWAEVDESRIDGDPFSEAGLIARSSDGSNYYRLTRTTGGATGYIDLYKQVGGTWTELDHVASPIQHGSTARLRLECIGTSIKGYVNGVEVVSAIDSDLTSGSAGIFFFTSFTGNTRRLDNFSAGDIVTLPLTDTQDTATGTATSVGPPPPVYFSDDFNRADEAYSDPDVTQSGTFNVVGNELHQTINYNGTVGLLYEPATITEDQFVEVTMWDAGDTYGHSLRVRGDSGSQNYDKITTGNGYMWNGLGGTDWEFARDGTTIWAWSDYSGADIDAGGTTFRLEASGADVTWYRDGVEVTSYTDGTPLTGGYPGFSVAPGELTNVFDNFSAGDLAYATTPAGPEAVLVDSGYNFANGATDFDATFTVEADSDYLLVWNINRGTGTGTMNPTATETVGTNLAAAPVRQALHENLIEWGYGVAAFTFSTGSSISGDTTLNLVGATNTYDSTWSVHKLTGVGTLSEALEWTTGLGVTSGEVNDSVGLAAVPADGSLVLTAVTYQATAGTGDDDYLSPTAQMEQVFQSGEPYQLGFVQQSNVRTVREVTVPQNTDPTTSNNFFAVTLVWAPPSFAITDIDWDLSFDAADLGYTLADGATVVTAPTQLGNDTPVWTVGGTPTFYENEFGDQPGVKFGGSGQHLQAYVDSSNNTYTIVGVAKVMDNDSDIWDGPSSNRVLMDASGGAWRTYAGSGVVTGGTADTDQHLFIMERNGSSTSVWVDGVKVIDAGSAGSHSVGQFYVGTSNQGTHGESRAAFVGVYDGFLTSGERDDILAWYQDRFTSPFTGSYVYFNGGKVRTRNAAGNAASLRDATGSRWEA